MAGVPIPEDTGGPISQDAAGKTIGEVLLAFSERQFVDACEDDVVPDIVEARSLLAGQAGGILGSDGFATADGADVDGMGESVLGVEGPTPGDLAIESEQQAVISAGPSICFKVDGPKRLPGGGIGEIVQGTNAGSDGAVAGMKLRGVAEVFVVAGEDMDAVRAQIGEGEQEVLRQGLLDGKAPSFDVEVGMMTNQSPRDQLGLSSAGRNIKVGGILQIAGLEKYLVLGEAGLPDYELILCAVAFESRVAVVILGGSGVDPESGSNDGFAVKSLGRPGNAKAGIKVLVIGVLESGGRRAESVASGEVENLHAVVRFGDGSVVVPTQPGVHGQVWSYLPLVLSVGHDKGAAQSVAVPGSGVINEVHLIVDEGGVVTRSTLQLDRQGRGFTLVQLDAPDLDARCYGVASLSPGQIVVVGIGGTNFIVGLTVVERLEICCREADVNESREHWVVKGRTIDTDLELVQQVGAEEVLESDEVVCGVIVGIVLVEEITVRRASEGDVALGTGVQSCGLGEFVVEARQPGIFVNDAFAPMRKIVERICDVAGAGIAHAWSKGRVGINEVWRAARTL